MADRCDWQRSAVCCTEAVVEWGGIKLEVCSSLFGDMFCFLPLLPNRVQLDNEYLGRKRSLFLSKGFENDSTVKIQVVLLGKVSNISYPNS